MPASEEARRLWDVFANAPKQIDLPLSAKRAAGAHAEDFTSEPAGVAFEDAPEVSGLWAIPDSPREGAAVLYLFGGGYAISSPASRRKTAGHLARASGARVLVPNYALAPEHPFPAALDDAVRAYLWLLTAGAAPRQTVIAGDSSGGGLAFATTLALTEHGASPPAGVVGISPWADLTSGGKSYITNAERDISVTRAGLLAMAADYCPGGDVRAPLISPVFADFTGFPPVFVVAGGDEVLLDDALALVRAAGIAGTSATAYIVSGMQHIFPIYAGAFPEADTAITVLGDWICARTS